MRSIALSKSGLNKVRSHQFELKASDLGDSIKSIPPGEWCRLTSGPDAWLCFLNPLVDDKYACAHVVSKIANAGEVSPESFISKKLQEAKTKRNLFSGYESNARIFYGSSDGLPGLIIDQFQNASIIQINTAGIDRYRDFIRSETEKLTESKTYLLDNQKYREKEFLPLYETSSVPELHVIENGIEFRIRPEVLQKVGFYFDHRENRLQLMSLLSRLKTTPVNGVDLFCYAGAWGMSALKAGVKEMAFVDQGDFSVEVDSALKLNHFTGHGSYHRSDVFKFLDESLKAGTQFDLILCDPPAFAKSAVQKSQALDGYSKLHRKVLKLLAPNSLVAFSSCTHYVNHDEFQKNILDASFRENKKIQLVYSGIQGFDHPLSSLNDKSSYIKSYFYLVE